MLYVYVMYVVGSKNKKGQSITRLLFNMEHIGALAMDHAYQNDGPFQMNLLAAVDLQMSLG